MKSKDWLDRQKRDFYVKNAQKQGYVSRAAFKLLEIEKKFKLIKNSKNIHILHITTKDEVDYVRGKKSEFVTLETTPQHLTLCAPDTVSYTHLTLPTNREV